MIEKKDEKNGTEMTETIVLKIFDMPKEIAADLLQFAKDECGNKAWVAVARLLEYRELSKQIALHEKRITALEHDSSGQQEKKTGEEGVKTFGGVLHG